MFSPLSILENLLDAVTRSSSEWVLLHCMSLSLGLFGTSYNKWRCCDRAHPFGVMTARPLILPPWSS